ncbi:MAG: beta-L-arabinofuranosidase domain-containing protein [Bacteroidales bacterium]
MKKSACRKNPFRNFNLFVLQGIVLLVALLVSNSTLWGQGKSVKGEQLEKIELTSPGQVSVEGFLGEALLKSESGRLLMLPHWNEGRLIKMFSHEARLGNERMDWYGEHAGKWLYTTAMAVARTDNPELKRLMLQTADYLVETQEPNGYLGSYSPEQQLTNKSISHYRSWDIWNLSYMVIGLLEVDHYFPAPKYTDAAKKIGELFLETFGDGETPVTDYGTREGISATIILEPVVELYELTSDERYLDFASLIIDQIEAKDGLKLVSMALHNYDMVNVGEGKAYQLIWNLTAITKLYRITGNPDYLKAVQNAWSNIVTYHLSINGGPWGGVGKMYELFNRNRYWSPYGFIETCSSMAWIQLNRVLFEVTGDVDYIHEIEKTTYNALLGAQYPDGVEWCYHTFTNGGRHAAHFDDCCSSSGALALEEIPQLIYSKREGGISCNLYTASKATLTVGKGIKVQIDQQTSYPFDGTIQLTVSPDRAVNFPLFIRIPDWAEEVAISINGEAVDKQLLFKGAYFKVERSWKKNDHVTIHFPFDLRLSHKIEKADKPQGGGDIYSVQWFALARGPLVYATNGLINGENREMVFNLPEENPVSLFKPVGSPGDFHGPAYELQLPGKEPLLFLPYFEAGGRTSGTWRLTWIQRAIH